MNFMMSDLAAAFYFFLFYFLFSHEMGCDRICHSMYTLGKINQYIRIKRVMIERERKKLLWRKRSKKPTRMLKYT